MASDELAGVPERLRLPAMHRRARDAPDARQVSGCPACLVEELPRQELAIVSQRVEALIVKRHRVEKQAVGDAPGLHPLVMRRGRGPVGSDERADRNVLGVAVGTEAAAHLLVHIDGPVLPAIEAEAVELAQPVANDNPVEGWNLPWRRKAETRDHAAGLYIRVVLRSVLDELEAELALCTDLDGVELQQARAAQDQDTV
mmetsp:Transcript_127600/g.272052  ORF Transcript_127600/g.272052 Transcript_127600/m.272052 type:complete len:200 (+) Transcript_127600:174-773(+)